MNFSTYFMFPDDVSRHVYWLMELSKSIRGWEVNQGNYDNFKNPEERKLMEKSATCIHKNLFYIKEHYPQVTEEFLNKAEKTENSIDRNAEGFSDPGKYGISGSCGFQCLVDWKSQI